MPCSATPTSAPATIASGMPVSRVRLAPGPGSTPTSSATSPISSATSSDSAGGGARRGGPARGADLRFDLEIAFDESYTGTETTIQIPREESCDTCKGSGAAAGTARETCPQCRGTGQLRYQQGFLVVARTCGQCGGSGQIVRTPCAACRGTGRVTRDRRVTVKIPAGIADGQRLRLHGEGEARRAAAARRATSTSSFTSASTKSSIATATTCTWTCNVPFPIMALGGTFKVEGPGGPIDVDVSAGNGQRHARGISREGHAERGWHAAAGRSSCGSSSKSPGG